MSEHPVRKKTINVFKEVKKTWGSYDEFPLAAAGVDPAPHLSRSRVAQPFHLVTAMDELLVTMAGTGHVEFRTPSGTKTVGFEPGDVIYLPARMPSRVLPASEPIQVRLKTIAPFQEAAAFFLHLVRRALALGRVRRGRATAGVLGGGRRVQLDGRPPDLRDVRSGGRSR